MRSAATTERTCGGASRVLVGTVVGAGAPEEGRGPRGLRTPTTNYVESPRGPGLPTTRARPGTVLTRVPAARDLEFCFRVCTVDRRVANLVQDEAREADAAPEDAEHDHGFDEEAGHRVTTTTQTAHAASMTRSWRVTMPTGSRREGSGA